MGDIIPLKVGSLYYIDGSPLEWEYLGIDDDEHYFLHTSKSRFTSGFQIGISFKSEELTNLKIKEVINE